MGISAWLQVMDPESEPTLGSHVNGHGCRGGSQSHMALAFSSLPVFVQMEYLTLTFAFLARKQVPVACISSCADRALEGAQWVQVLVWLLLKELTWNGKWRSKADVSARTGSQLHGRNSICQERHMGKPAAAGVGAGPGKARLLAKGSVFVVGFFALHSLLCCFSFFP